MPTCSVTPLSGPLFPYLQMPSYISLGMLRFRMPRRDNELQEKKCEHWGRKDRAFQYTRGSVRANGISDEGKLTPPRKEDQHMRTGPRSGKRAPDNDKRMDVLKESNRVAGEHRGHQRPPALSSDSTSTKPHVNVFTTRLGLWHLPGQNLLIITYCLQYFKGKRKKNSTTLLPQNFLSMISKFLSEFQSFFIHIW